MVGRRDELVEALRILEDDGPRVLCVHGPAGLGKSTLLTAAGEAARRRGATVVQLDCRDLEPTTRGLLSALSRYAGTEVDTLDEAAALLGSLGPVVVLALDTYELFRLSDAWLRRVFVPSLPDNVRLVVAGREPPTSEWWSSPGWDRTFAGLRLGPLPEADALELLERAGLSRHEASRLNEVARGHPLALRTEVADADRTELWRYTADLLYLLENPAVREAFFPTSEYRYAVEPATIEDGDAILDIAVRHDPPGAVAILEWWWRRAPGCFRVVRDRRGAVVGFSLLLDLSCLDQRALDVDPVMAAWLRHLREEPVPPGQRVLLHRRRLGRDAGEGPSALQAASWLDIKRRYTGLRPTLRRLYA